MREITARWMRDYKRTAPRTKPSAASRQRSSASAAKPPNSLLLCCLLDGGGYAAPDSPPNGAALTLGGLVPQVGGNAFRFAV